LKRVSYDFGDWAPYVTVAERRRDAARAAEKLRKKDPGVAPVTIEGSRIATSFWGKAWCDTIESFRDYEYRLERGRSYVRHGAVVDLRIAPGEVTARVNGSVLYRTKITITPTPPAKWRAICADCTGRIDSLVELLQGRFSKPVMERLCNQDSGLFPRPSEIKFSCSCLDHASMCKHVAAVLYGIGARLDHSPELLFRLRAVDETALFDLDAAQPRARKGPDAGKALAGDDLAALFGLDMIVADTDVPAAPRPQVIPPAHHKAAKGGAAKRIPVTTSPAVPEPVQMTNARMGKVGTTLAPAKAARNNTAAAPTAAKVKQPTATKPATAGGKVPAKSVASTQATVPARPQSARGSATRPTPVHATAARGRAGGRQARSAAHPAE
jgi:uncharacterized Zn finger protein